MTGHDKATSASASVASGARYDDKVRLRALELRREKKWTITRISRELGPSERTLRRWFDGLPTLSRVRHNHEAIRRELNRVPRIPAKQIARKCRCGIATVYLIRRQMLAEQQGKKP